MEGKLTNEEVVEAVGNFIYKDTEDFLETADTQEIIDLIVDLKMMHQYERHRKMYFDSKNIITNR